MINKDQIKIGEMIYYIPQRWEGSCSKVKVLQVIDNSWVEVVDKKNKPFRFKIEHMYITPKAAIMGFYNMNKQIKKAKKINKAKTKSKKQETNITINKFCWSVATLFNIGSLYLLKI